MRFWHFKQCFRNTYYICDRSTNIWEDRIDPNKCNAIDVTIILSISNAEPDTNDTSTTAQTSVKQCSTGFGNKNLHYKRLKVSIVVHGSLSHAATIWQSLGHTTCIYLVFQFLANNRIINNNDGLNDNKFSGKFV